MSTDVDGYVDPIEFRLLGPLRAERRGAEIDLGGQREQRLLVPLLRSAGQWVNRAGLAGWVWDEEPTDRAALDEVAGDLRKVLLRMGLEGKFTSKNGLCRLDVPAESVDAHRLKRLAARVDEVSGTEQRDLLRSALELRRGEPLENLGGARIAEFRSELAARYRRLEIQFAQLEVRHGRGAGRLLDLERLYRENPVDVIAAGLLMVALYYTGNPTRVHEIFLDHRGHLDAQGYEVPERLATLYQRLLSSDTGLGRADEYFLGGPYRPQENVADATGSADDDSQHDPSERHQAVHQIFNGTINAEAPVFGIVNNHGYSR